MAILKGVLIFIIGLVVLFFGIAFFLPSTAHVERSVVIDAPQASIFALTNSFTRFNEWSPWAEIDPEASYGYEGPSVGRGAKMSWTSTHPNVGSGSQEIVSSTPWSEVKSHLDFGEQGTAEAFFRLAPEGDAVKVTWGFDTDIGFNLVGRWFGLFFDSWIGPDYEKGLAKLKVVAEALPKDDWSELKISVVEMEPITIASNRGSCPHATDAIGPALAKAYGTVSRFLARNKLEMAGMPLVINHEWRTTYEFEAGIPIASDAAPPGTDGEVTITTTPGGPMVKAVHVGPYAEMGGTYSKLKAYAAAHGLQIVEPAWEQYVSDPGDTPEEDLITHLYYPID